MNESVVCGFRMGLLARIKIATMIWYAIVFKGELICDDDRTPEETRNDWVHHRLSYDEKEKQIKEEEG